MASVHDASDWNLSFNWSSLEEYDCHSCGKLIDDHTKVIMVAVFQVALTGAFAVIGICTNIINIIVFVSMGMRDAVNVSLLGLAIGDLLSLIFSLWESICFNTLIQDTDIPVVLTEIEYITGCWPHVMFVRVTSYITAFITLERCLCVTLPLKVKSIITVRRAKIVIVAIYLLVMMSSIPEYYVTQLAWKWYPDVNRTMLGVIFIEDRDKYESVTLLLNNVILQCIAFTCVVVCTVILIVKLNQNSKWRQQKTTGDGGSGASGKDKKVVKMITLVAIIFIICNLPSCLVFIAMSATDRLHPTGVNVNMFYVVWAIVYVVEGINSSVNIMVYLNMSSKYKTVFYKVFLNKELNTGQETSTIVSTVQSERLDSSK